MAGGWRPCRISRHAANGRRDSHCLPPSFASFAALPASASCIPVRPASLPLAAASSRPILFLFAPVPRSMLPPRRELACPFPLRAHNPRFPSPQTGVVRPALSPPIAPISFIRAPASPPRRCPSCPPLRPLSRHSSPSYPPATGIRRRGSSSPSPTPNAPPPYRPQTSAHPPPRRPNLPPAAPRRQALYIHTPPYGVSTCRIQVALAETKHAAMEKKKVQPRAHKGPERRTPGVNMNGRRVRPRAHKGPGRRAAGVYFHTEIKCGLGPTRAPSDAPRGQIFRGRESAA